MCKWNAHGGNDWTKIRATQSSWADIVSNKTKDLQQYRQTSQTVSNTADRQENNPRTRNENTTLNTGGQAQNICETDIEQASQINTERSPILERGPGHGHRETTHMTH